MNWFLKKMNQTAGIWLPTKLLLISVFFRSLDSDGLSRFPVHDTSHRHGRWPSGGKLHAVAIGKINGSNISNVRTLYIASYSIHCIIYSIHCIIYSIHCTILYTLHHIFYTLHHILYALHQSLYIASYSMHCIILYTLHHSLYIALYSIHCIILYTLHHASYSIHCQYHLGNDPPKAS